MTPAQSDYRGSNSPESLNGGGALTSQSSHFNPLDYDMDMEDEDDLDVRSQPPESPAFSTSSSNLFMRPAMLKPSLISISSEAAANTGRIPTPIHPTFKRSGMGMGMGGMHGLGYPTSGSAGGGLNTSTSGAVGGVVPSMQGGGRPPPPSSARKGGGGQHRPDMDNNDPRNRRMPSPISEDEDIPDTPTALTQSQLSRLSFSHPHPPPNYSSDQMMETEVSDTAAAAALALLPPPTPRGRKRSGALTGMGRFSMGYRDDCEKCRLRVPGHYSHFLP